MTRHGGPQFGACLILCDVKQGLEHTRIWHRKKSALSWELLSTVFGGFVIEGKMFMCFFGPLTCAEPQYVPNSGLKRFPIEWRLEN